MENGIKAQINRGKVRTVHGRTFHTLGPRRAYKVWIECGDVVLETDDLPAAIAECKRYAESDGAYITDYEDRCL